MSRGRSTFASLPAIQLADGTHALVSDVDNPGRKAFVVDLCANPSDPYDICDGAPASATLPPGRRYVIEQVSGRCKVHVMETINGVRLVQLHAVRLSLEHADLSD
jgi:hypothetical protein